MSGLISKSEKGILDLCRKWRWQWRERRVRAPETVAGLTDRADERELMVWLLGRGPAPELRPWG